MTALSLVQSLSSSLGNADAVGLHALDTLAVLSASLDTGEGAAIARFYDDGSVASRIAGMAAVARFTECDDIHVPSCLTPGCVVLPVALEYARDADHFARAVEAGYAIGLALAQSIGGAAALGDGVWPTLFAAPAMAAATTAVALGLDEEKALHALTIAMAGASGRAGRPGGYPSGRWLAIGEAVLKGLRAAFAAEQGFGGDAGLFSAEWLRAQTGRGLAAPDYLDVVSPDSVGQVGLKPFVAARQGANAIEAFFQLLQNDLSLNDVTSLDVFLPSIAVPVVARPLDLESRLSTIAHLGLQLALVAHEPERLFDIARDRPFKGETLGFATRVTVHADRALEQGPANSWPARVVAHTAAGDREARCDLLPGDAGDSAQAAMLVRKIQRLCGSAMPASPTGGADHRFQTYKRLHAGLGSRFSGATNNSGQSKTA